MPPTWTGSSRSHGELTAQDLLKTASDSSREHSEPRARNGHLATIGQVPHNRLGAPSQAAGVVAEGVTSGERMHKARHTAGQRVLDHTHGNLKAVQKLLGHSSISTTGDIYTDWDIDQLAETLRGMLEDRL